MRSGGGKVMITLAAEDVKVCIVWWSAKKGAMWCREIKCLGRQDVKKIGGSVEGFNPVIRGGNTSLKQERANNVICGIDDALGNTVLGGGVGT